MIIDLEEVRSDINRLDSMVAEVRDYIYEIDDTEETYGILDAMDELQAKITELQIRQRWI